MAVQRGLVYIDRLNLIHNYIWELIKQNKQYTLYILLVCSRIQGEDTLSKLTRYGLNHFEKGYLENDRQVFLILLAMEVHTIMDL